MTEEIEESEKSSMFDKAQIKMVLSMLKPIISNMIIDMRNRSVFNERIQKEIFIRLIALTKDLTKQDHAKALNTYCKLYNEYEVSDIDNNYQIINNGWEFILSKISEQIGT